VTALQAWEDGGYSDDMIATARCNELSLRIGSPASAVFAQTIEKGTTVHDHWDYLRR
jgi:hypothetical protein